MKLRLLTIRFLLGFFFVCAAQANSAVLHTVQFGGNLGLTFSPKSFSATVGDTVEWDGDFGPHVLSSTTIPAGAASWHNATGTTFRYVITVAGSYNYQCDIHVSLGMIGSFTASASAVREIPRLSDVVSNPQLRIVASATRAPSVEFEIQSASFVRLELLDMKGRMISLIFGRVYPTGVYRTALRPGLTAGKYIVRLSANGSQDVETAIAIK